mgnify:CR=1 FL=1
MGAKINGIHTKTGYGLDLLAIEIGIPEPARKKQQVPGRNFFYTEGVEGIFEQRTIKLTIWIIIASGFRRLMNCQP